MMYDGSQFTKKELNQIEKHRYSQISTKEEEDSPVKINNDLEDEESDHDAPEVTPQLLKKYNNTRIISHSQDVKKLVQQQKPMNEAKSSFGESEQIQYIYQYILDVEKKRHDRFVNQVENLFETDPLQFDEREVLKRL